MSDNYRCTREGGSKVWLTLILVRTHDGVSFKIPNFHERKSPFDPGFECISVIH